MKITNLEATFDKGKGSIAFDMEEAVIEDLSAVMNVLSSFVNHPSNEKEIENE